MSGWIALEMAGGFALRSLFFADAVRNTAGLLPSPARGRGAGGEGRRVASTIAFHFVDMPALTPTLSRKREREHPLGPV
ncbi:hypothetical protein FQZ97_1205470 [compost metagenome]